MSPNPSGDQPKTVATDASPVDPQVTAAFKADTEPNMGATARVAHADWVGKAIGKYQVVGVLGQGGMGIVLKARDPLIEREVAIKVLPSHLANDSVSLQRFLAEAKAAGKLNHPNVVTIFEIGQQGDLCYLVLELVTGGSLDGAIKPGQGLPVLEATRVIADACRGVGAAHAVGMIHRDIKPANFMRAADGSTKVADFGLAKTRANSQSHLTQTGMVVGTPYFMSPEQCQAKPLDARSDIYSLGATYYCLLTGNNPYQECDSVTQVMYQHCHGPVPDPRETKRLVPEACSRIIARAMAKSPADRYPNAEAMLADLQQLDAALSGQGHIALPSDSQARRVTADDSGLSRRSLWMVLGGLAGVAIIAAAVAFMLPRKDAGVAPVTAGEPIKIGVLHSLTGTMAASESPVVDAVLFAIDEVNAAGGVLGRPVKAVVADGGSEDSTFAREAERLLSAEQVDVVFGCWTSSSRKTVKPLFEQRDKLLFYPVQFEGLETSPSVVYLGASPNQQILPAIRWARTSLEKKRFFLVGSDYVYPRAANAIIKDYLQREGLTVVGEKYLPLGSQEVNEVVNAIAQSKPDMVLNTINGDSNIAFFRALRAAAVTSAMTPTLSFSIGVQGMRNLSPDDVAGDYVSAMYFQSIESPENKEFVNRFQEKHPLYSISDPMESAYMGVKLWAAAANEAQSTDPRKVRRTLLTQRFGGPGGEVRLDSDSQYSYRTPRIGQIQADRQLKVVWTETRPVRPQPYPETRTAEAWRAYLNDLYTGWGHRWSNESR